MVCLVLSVLLLSLLRDGEQPLAGHPAPAAPLERLQGAVKQEEQASDQDNGENEDDVHAPSFRLFTDSHL
jgi:hypothetical protein